VKKTVSLDGPDEVPPAQGKPGDVVAHAKEHYAPGELVTVVFWTGSPVNDYRRTDHFLAVERRSPGSDTWQVVREDFDWDTTARWKQMIPDADAKTAKDPRPEGERIGPVPRIARPDPYQVTITWQTDEQTAPGTYRIVHFGRFKKDGKVERFQTSCRAFE